MSFALFKKSAKSKHQPDKVIQNPGGSFSRFFKNPYVMVGVVVFAVVGTATLLLSSAATQTTSSVRAGQWSDANTWQGNRVPRAGDKVVIAQGHNVTLDSDVRVAGLEVQDRAILQFAPGKSAQLQTSKNIIVRGTLIMIPRSNAQEQTITFTGVNNSKFSGGGMDPVDSDVGLWVVGNGLLNINGTEKTSWTNLSGSVQQGQTTVRLKNRPANWLPGDEIFISPTQAATDSVGKAAWEGFDEAVITQVTNARVSVANQLRYDHPQVNNKWTAEVGNLTRNVKIQGTESGNSHIFIRSTKPQNIRYAELRYMGVAQDKPDASKHTGRYAIHFHHGGNGSRGSDVTGVVVHKAANHAYVPHASHGITFKDTIAYNTLGDAYWWDPNTKEAKHAGMSNTSDDILIDHAIAAKVNGKGIRLGGFRLAEGSSTNTLKNSVAVGVVGGEQSAGFTWQGGATPWNFNNNIAHNNKLNGIIVWQNDGKDHLIKDFTAYHNHTGIFHGAYKNHYVYRDSTLYANKEAGIFLHATSDKKLLRFENITIDGAGTGRVGIKACCHKVAGNNYPTIFSGGAIRNVNFGVIMNKSEQRGVGAWLQFNNVRMDTKTDYFLHSIIEPSSSLEVNNTTSHYCLTTQALAGKNSVFIKSQNAWRTNLTRPHTSGTTTITGC